jgi:hypothetical protein
MTPAQIDSAIEKPSLTNLQFYLMLAIDLLLGIALLWRDYSDHGQMLIGRG